MAGFARSALSLKKNQIGRTAQFDDGENRRGYCEQGREADGCRRGISKIAERKPTPTEASAAPRP